MKEFKEILKITGITRGMFNAYKNLGLIDNYAKKTGTPGINRGGFRYYYDDRIIDQIRQVNENSAQGISLQEQQRRKWLANDKVVDELKEKLDVTSDDTRNLILNSLEGADKSKAKALQDSFDVEQVKHHARELARILSGMDEGYRRHYLGVIRSMLDEKKLKHSSMEVKQDTKGVSK
jgi:DNA-binding transcriptional MerR regulator